MRAAFAGDGYLPRDGFLNYVIDDYPLRIVALDTLSRVKAGASSVPDRLRWLDETLRAAPTGPA